jgi:hypothetical protein
MNLFQSIKVNLRARSIMKDYVNMESYINEVLGDVPFTINPDLPCPAVCLDDQSAIVFKAWDKTMAIQLAAASKNQTFKQSIQAMAAHEKGHYVHAHMKEVQRRIIEAFYDEDYDRYRTLTLHREKRAWELGREFAIDKDYYEGFNKTNMYLYEIKLQSDKETMFPS